jgi:hypothetical protein
VPTKTQLADPVLENRPVSLRNFGRDDWIRTSDPLTPSQVRYQAAPHPDALIVQRIAVILSAPGHPNLTWRATEVAPYRSFSVIRQSANLSICHY